MAGYRRKYQRRRRIGAARQSGETELLVLYHRANAGGGVALPNPEQAIIEEMRQLYPGRVAAAHDLDIF